MAEEAQAEPRTGTERAAILLLSLGEQEAAQVLKHMGARDVQRVGAAMATLKNVSRDEVSEELQDVSTKEENQASVGVGADECLRKVLTDALGDDKAQSVIERINLGPTSKGLEALKWMDPRAVAELIRLEHPQIIAIVLAYLDPDQAAEVLGNFPVPVRADVVLRIATLDGIQPTALHELDEVIEKQFAGRTGGLKTSVIGGVKCAANILNFMDSADEASVVELVSKADEALGTEIQDLMFVFDDIAEIDD